MSIGLEEPEDLTMASPRYFLIEATAPDEGTASRLCQWRDGTHRSHGEAPPLGVANFFEAVNRLMAEPVPERQG